MPSGRHSRRAYRESSRGRCERVADDTHPDTAPADDVAQHRQRRVFLRVSGDSAADGSRLLPQAGSTRANRFPDSRRSSNRHSYGHPANPGRRRTRRTPRQRTPTAARHRQRSPGGPRGRVPNRGLSSSGPRGVPRMARNQWRDRARPASAGGRIPRLARRRALGHSRRDANRIMSELLSSPTATVFDVRTLARGGMLYAILDACDAPAVPPKVESLGEARGVSLYKGTSQERYADIAPYLVAVDDELLDWILTTLWSEPWGVFAQTKASIDELRTHFRKFLIATGPNGEEWYFRFYDPR